MFHYVNAITNTKGDALIGYYVKCVDTSNGSVVPMYSDASGTAIETESGVENACKVNSDGNASFYVDDGEYHLNIYATDGTTFVRQIPRIPMAKTGVLLAANVGVLATLDTSYPAVLTESGAEGLFVFKSEDLSSEVANDPDQSTYVAPASDDTGSSGAWVRTNGSTGTAVDNNGSMVISGCGVIYAGNLTFNMSAGTYYLDGVLHSAAAQTLNLAAADATNPRIDVLYVDSNGLFGKVTGTPAVNPSQPSLDPTTQLYLSFVLVPATATSLSGITTEDIYLENTEWTTSRIGTGITLASTNNPDTGTKCIETNGAQETPDYVKFTRSGAMLFAGDGNLILRIRSKGSWNSKRSLLIQWIGANGDTGSAATLKHGTFGFDSSNTSAYQSIVISKSLFAVTAGTQITDLRITLAGTAGAAPGFYLDNIKLQNTGSTMGSGVPGLTQDQADARYVKLTSVSDAAYDATAWNGSLDIPTKNAVRDIIQSISGSSLGALLAANNLSDLANAATARTNLGINSTNVKLTESLILAPSDETTALTTGTAKITFRMPYAFTVTAVRASLTTAQTSGSIFTVDINESGTSILSTKLTIDNTEKTSTTAATAPVISDSSIADDAEITVDIDQVGDGTAKGLKVVLIGNRT